MIGGLQGEFGDLDIKYLKQNIDHKYREALGEHHSCACKRAAKFRSKKDNIS